jgi:uncharacterized protein (DUF1501 family)
MDRRDFLKAGLFSLAALLPGAAGWAFENPTGGNGRKLVVVFLRGAVDGLNVVIPYGDPRYYSMRPSIAVARPGTEFGAIDLDGYFGVHPSLKPLMPFFQQKQLAFVHASGSPDETRSHFDAQDYMESGIPGQKMVSTGWLNRILAELPDNHSPVRAVNFGETLPRILAGPAEVAMASNVLLRTGRPIRLPAASAIEAMYADRRDDLGKTYREGIEAEKQLITDLNDNSADGDRIMKASNGAPTPNALPNFGQKIAHLLTHDPAVQVAFLALGGWDTHVNEGSGKGQLANKLAALSNGLAELATGLGDQFQKTTIVVMSEFGRTAKENGNGGTDHGHGNAMWVLGGPVSGGRVLGRWSSLSDRDLHEGRDLPVTTDFRTVVASLAAEHLELSQKGLTRIFPEFSLQERLSLLA